MSATHLLAPTKSGDPERSRRAACGRVERLDGRIERAAFRLDLTQSAVEVTCRKCREAIGRVAERARVAETIAAAVWQSRQAPLSRDDHAAIRRSIEGAPEKTGPRWFSVDAAAEHEARVVLDGAPIRSSSDTDRYGVLPQRTVGEVPLPAAIAGRDDVLAFRTSLARASASCAAAIVIGRIGIPANLDADDFELVFRWSKQGEPSWQPIDPEAWGAYERKVRSRPAVAELDEARASAPQTVTAEMEHAARVARGGVPFVGRKGGVWRLVPRTDEEIAATLARKHGRDVTERQVSIARSAVVEAFARALRGMGELAERREEASVAAPEGFDVEGWAAIGKVVGRSEDVCQKLAKRDGDPLPIERYLGAVIAKRDDLRAWVQREVERSRAA